MGSLATVPLHSAHLTLEGLLTEYRRQPPWIYWLLLVGIIATVVALPLTPVDVSVRGSGLIRPATERIELKPAVSGHIASMLAHENDPVIAGQPVLTLRSDELDERLILSRRQLADYDDIVADLQALCADQARPADQRSGTLDLRKASLRQQHSQLAAQTEAARLAVNKALADLDRIARLTDKGIATQRDHDNARYEVSRLEAELRLTSEQALTHWQDRLDETVASRAALESQIARQTEEKARYTLLAPVTGSLLGTTGLGAGGYVLAGQTLGFISPDEVLLLDTAVSSRDIGLVRVGQSVKIQVDAFPYTEWGTAAGQVATISSDLLPTPGETKTGPQFRVTIRMATAALRQSNGLRGELKKGMTAHARLLGDRRTLWSLLRGRLSQWLDPGAPTARRGPNS